MSKKKHQPLMDKERKERIIDEFVKMYIEKGGQMPTLRNIKKNPYITEREVATLRADNQLTEAEVRRRAERLTGERFLSPQERRTLEMRQRYGHQAVTSQKQDAAEPPTKTKKTSRCGRKTSREEVLRDLRTLAEKLGHMPTQLEINCGDYDPGHSYQTFIKYLGPKSGWAKLLEEVDTNA